MFTSHILRKQERHLLARRAFPFLLGSFFIFFLGVARPALCQDDKSGELIIPAGTPIEAKLSRHIPMKLGQPVEATLAHPVYANNKLALPEGARLQGSVVSLEPDRDLRNDARLNVDFTPYHKPTVTFTGATLADGTKVPLSTTPSSDGAPAIHLTPSASKPSTLIAMGVESVKGWISSTREALFSPGLGDRMVQLFYKQLPYHPERIQQGTTWTCELREPVTVPGPPANAVNAGNPIGHPLSVSDSSDKKNLELHAYLDEELSSANAKVGQQFQATVTEPVFGADHSLIVPQGAVLIGRVTRANPAKSFHRDGKLRFDFRQLQMPSGTQEQITGSLNGMEAKSGASLKMDSEGGVQSQQQGKVIVPLILTALASRPLSDDWSAQGGAAVGSNGMGLIGRVVGITAASRNLAAGIGFYGAGVSVYRRWLRHGKDLTFPKDNRIDIEVSQRSGQQLSQR
ncbi:MAG: TrbI/VirB10 family protein [Silvibacterium sp.]|nr:TrbI/VirB10 family protein [Silvibacterium sp.]MBV8436471.1 TrbI/VirB10 family protein [Silvibacterium sp.]